MHGPLVSKKMVQYICIWASSAKDYHVLDIALLRPDAPDVESVSHASCTS